MKYFTLKKLMKKFTLKHVKEKLFQNKVNKVRKYKSNRAKYGYKYIDNPQITYIIQFFNKRHNVGPIIRNLRLTNPEEIIVNDDGSIDGSYREWLKVLDKPNEFIIRSNDLHEILAYDRAIRMAKGEFICFMQDDDIPPDNPQWVVDALTLFSQFPNLIILGGRDGVDINVNLSNNPRERYEIHGAPGFPKFGQGSEYVTEQTKIPFMFCMIVNRAPWFVRREEFMKIGGISTDYAPLLCDDDDVCLKAWINGYSVGMYHCPFSRYVDGIEKCGSVLFDPDSVRRQQKINFKKINERYGDYIRSGFLKNLVDKENSSLIKKES